MKQEVNLKLVLTTEKEGSAMRIELYEGSTLVYAEDHNDHRIVAKRAAVPITKAVERLVKIGLNQERK